MSDPTVLLTAQEVAERLRMPFETVKYWRQKGTGPRYLRIGRRIFYAEGDLEAWINAQFADSKRGAA